MIIALSVGCLAGKADAGMRLGAGIHYLRTVGDLKDTPGFDKDDLSFLVSLKYGLGLIKVEGDIEFLPDYVGSDLLMIEPQAYALIGNLIYGGVGIGVGHLEDFGWQDPFYALRAGVDLDLGPIGLDAFASYRFQKAKDLATLESDDLNAVTLGAIFTFGF
jgi:hypothetical protein